MAMRASRTHFRTIGGEPADVEAFAHPHLGQQLSEQQNTLSAEPRHLHGELFEMVCVLRAIEPRSFCLSRNLQNIGDWPYGWSVVLDPLWLLVTEYGQRECGDHGFSDPFPCNHRILRPYGGAGRKNFYKRKPGAIALGLEPFSDGAARLHDVLVVAECDALDVHRRFEGRDEFGHVERKAFVARTTSPRRSRTFLPHERGGGHLPACHTVDRVVHEKDGDFLAAIGSVNDFGSTDGC